MEVTCKLGAKIQNHITQFILEYMIAIFLTKTMRSILKNNSFSIFEEWIKFRGKNFQKNIFPCRSFFTNSRITISWFFWQRSCECSSEKISGEINKKSRASHRDIAIKNFSPALPVLSQEGMHFLWKKYSHAIPVFVRHLKAACTSCTFSLCFLYIVFVFYKKT